MRSAAVLLLLAGCDQAEPQATSAGAQLEAAAVRSGLVPDPARATLIGAWSRETDRACVVPGEGGRERIGVLIDYGEGGGCIGTGTLRRSGDRLDVELGSCRVDARFDGERILFPVEIEPACDRLCRGNATLAAFSVEQVSQSAAEAATVRAPSGKFLCPN